MSITTESRIASASTITGQKIYNKENKEIGKIEDIMLDLQEGKIGYVVLSFGGFMGLGSKLFAVPMQSLTADAEKECFHADISKKQLENAPGFDKDNWPSTYDQKFVNSVYTHYGVRT
jgi:sporulation protein YlmC with PRC-barrel domain